MILCLSLLHLFHKIKQTEVFTLYLTLLALLLIYIDIHGWSLWLYFLLFRYLVYHQRQPPEPELLFFSFVFYLLKAFLSMSPFPFITWNRLPSYFQDRYITPLLSLHHYSISQFSIIYQVFGSQQLLLTWILHFIRAENPNFVLWTG